MRVQAGERDPASGVAMKAVQGFDDPAGADLVEGLPQRHVDGEERHLELRRQEGHQVVPAVALQAAGLGEVVGVAPEVPAEIPSDRLLAHRRGDQGIDSS
jgi:hypothetical protein